MTALPEPKNPPEPRLLTVAEYAALGETESGYTELQEGLLLVAPSPRPNDNIASGELFAQLRPQTPADLRVIQDIDVDLELALPDKAGFVRRPDLVVVDRAATARIDAEGGLLRAADIRLVVEIVSIGSQRMDHVVKRGEYADAGIPHYWIIDLDQPASVVVCHLAGEFGYQDSMTAIGKVTLDEPFPMTIDLDQLD